jgi:hypothetical protein
MKQVLFLSVALLLSFNVRADEVTAKLSVALFEQSSVHDRMSAFDNAAVWNKIDEARRAEVKQFTIALMAFSNCSVSAEYLKAVFAKHDLGICEGRIAELSDLIIKNRSNPDVIALLTKVEQPVVPQEEKQAVTPEAPKAEASLLVTVAAAPVVCSVLAEKVEAPKEEGKKEVTGCELLAAKVAPVEPKPTESPLAEKAAEQKN